MSPTRRQFLKTAAGATSLLSLAPAMPAFLHRTAVAADSLPNSKDTVLVVMQLSGGNDGLNTVVPYADDVYGRSRRTLRLTKKDVIPIDSLLGLHPRMTGFKRLLDDGHLMVVQGVGYPNNNRSHDAAMRDWHTAHPADTTCQTGWIGRAVDLVSQRDPSSVPAALVGPIALPFALNAEASVVPAIRAVDQLSRRASTVGAAKLVDVPASSQNRAGQSSPPLVDFVRQASLASRDIDRRVQKILASAKSGSAYPDFTLAGQLRTVAQLIQAGLGTRIYFVEIGGGGIGGFDNHANQRDNHAALLHELSESIAAFVADLNRSNSLSRVLLMTFSEFGRTVSENGRRGTGHGSAAPVFLAGGKLKGGLLGRHPRLTDLVQDAPKFHTDFRRVYATVLQDWLGYDAAAILGQSYRSLDIFA